MRSIAQRSCEVLGAVVLLLMGADFSRAQNPIQIENSNTGTSNWQLTNPATGREIEGYASLTSVNAGGSINFFVSTSDPSFTLEIFRTGWYGGLGARLLSTVSNLTGKLQTTPAPDPTTGKVECQWTSSYTLTVPSTWVSGVFLARLTGSRSGKQSYIIFVVRNDGRSSDVLYEQSVTTYEAYNFWPNGANGKSLYTWAPGGRAWKVSFNRPYVLGDSYTSSTTGAATGVGAGEYLTVLYPGPASGYPITPAGFEYNMVRWLEKNGYDVSYVTDVDLHESASFFNGHKAFLSVGHNEYWSSQMRQNLQTALANGVNAGFFSSNTIYWQIRLEAGFDGAADRTIVCYKYDAASSDPDYSSNPSLTTTEWRNAPVNMPEAAVEGVEYVGDPVSADIVVSNASHWLFNGTGLHNGDHLTGLLGIEADLDVPGTSPANAIVLASSPVGPFPQDYDNPPGFSCNTQQCNSNMTWYSAGKAFVFSTGSMQFSWGLDDYNAPSLRSAFSNAAAQTFTANVLGAFITPVTVTTSTLPTGTAGVAYSAFQLTASGGGPPYTWTASGLPSGMSLSSGGVLSGTPAAAGTFPVTFTATDNASKTGSKGLNLVVNPGTTTYTISGQITLAGAGLGGVTVTLSTGPTTTTNSSGNYSFNNLPGGTYTVTPSLSGYTFNPSSSTFTNITSNQTANFTASIVNATARAVSINFVGQNTTPMGASESAGVVAKTHWNNASGNVSSSALALVDETGAANGAAVTWTSDNLWNVSITDSPGNNRMMRGYLDNGNENTTTVNVTGLPASSSGYDIYVYIDGDNGTSATTTGTYTLSGPGITTASIQCTDRIGVNFSGTFVQAINSAGNYVKFSGIRATGFTLQAIPVSATDGYPRAPLNGIQIVPSPAVSARAVSINFVGQTTTPMGATESAGVVAKTNWNNASGNASSSALALVDETGAANGASVTWTSDNVWNVSITDSAGNNRMMRGYLDNGNENTTTVNVMGLPASSTGYDIYVYIDGDNGTSATTTGTYTLSGPGITTASVQCTDRIGVNFSGTFVQAINSAGNYIKFSGIQATGFTLEAIPVSATDGYPRAPLNGIQIVPSPAAPPARAVSINFVGSDVSMAASESAGVVAKTNWNNASGNASSSALALVDETGAANGAAVTWTSDNVWSTPVTDSPGNYRMMKGYLDNGNQNTSTVNVMGLPVSSTGYDIYVYFNGGAANVQKTGTYSISGPGITTTSIATIDAANSFFSGTFVQANNSAGNYVKFSGVQATGFTLQAIPTAASDGNPRAALNGIQIVPH